MLGSRFPQTDPFPHDSGHLWHTLLGWTGDPHSDPLHIMSSVVSIGGFWSLASAWPVLFAAQRDGRLAKTGLYARNRHLQYAGFVLIILGFLLQLPTIATLSMFPVLVWMYARLAAREEREGLAQFGDENTRYAAGTPRFFPSLSGSAARRISS